MSSSEWQPIETAPKDGTWFLVVDPNSNMCWAPYGFCAWMTDWSGKSYWCEEDVSEEIFPTHWMPLSDPPTPREAGS
jgi:hypothetical protein